MTINDGRVLISHLLIEASHLLVTTGRSLVYIGVL